MVACDSLHGGTTKRKRRGDTGSIRLLSVGQTDIGTGSLYGLGNPEDSRAYGMRRVMFAEYMRDFQLGSEIDRNCFGSPYAFNVHYKPSIATTD